MGKTFLTKVLLLIRLYFGQMAWTTFLLIHHQRCTNPSPNYQPRGGEHEQIFCRGFVSTPFDQAYNEEYYWYSKR
jgi:hypothetical protein